MEWVSKSLSFLYPYSYHGNKIKITIENKTKRCFYQTKKFIPSKFFVYDEHLLPTTTKIKGPRGIQEQKFLTLQQLVSLSECDSIIVTIEHEDLILQTNLKSKKPHFLVGNYSWKVKQLPKGRLTSRCAAIWNFCEPNLTAFCFYAKFDEQSIKLMNKYNLKIKNLYYWYDWRSEGNQFAEIGAYFIGLQFRLSQSNSGFSLSRRNRVPHNNFSYIMQLLYDHGFFHLEDMTADKLRRIGRLFYLKKEIKSNKRKIWNMLFHSHVELKLIKELKPIFDFFDKYQRLVRKIQRKYRQKHCIKLRRYGFFGFLKYYRIVNTYIRRLDIKIMASISEQCFNYLRCGHPIHKGQIRRDRNWHEIRKILLQHYYNRRNHLETPQIQFLCCECHRENMRRRKQRRRVIKDLRRIFTNFHDLFTFVNGMEIESAVV